jgi:hypothetical protein
MGFENGPFRAEEDGGLTLNALSWNKFATVVYIEQPIGVGFSFSANPAEYEKLNDAVAATDNAAFLTAFFEANPRFQSNPLFLTSESYGGAYIPQLSAQILRGADTRLAAQLKKGGFAVGNPVFSIDENATFVNIMNVVTADILFGRSLLPLSFVQRYRAAGCDALAQPKACDALTDEMFALAGHCWSDENFEGNDCGDNMYSTPFGNATLGIATAPSADVDALWTRYLNRKDVQAAIHAAPPRAPWSDCSNIGYDVTWPSSMPDYAAAFAAGLKVLVFSGDVDVTTCPFASTQVAVRALEATAGGAVTQPWTAWHVPGSFGNATAGYLEEHEKFFFATIKGAGHEAPGFQPTAAHTLIRAFVEGRLREVAPLRPAHSAAAAEDAQGARPPRSQAAALKRAMKMSRK